MLCLRRPVQTPGEQDAVLGHEPLAPMSNHGLVRLGLGPQVGVALGILSAPGLHRSTTPSFGALPVASVMLEFAVMRHALSILRRLHGHMAARHVSAGRM